MKKLAVLSLAALIAAGNAQALELTGPELLLGGAVVTTVVVAVVNADGTTSVIETPDPVQVQCGGTDPLVAGYCIGTKMETIVSGTGTNTFTQVVPVTYKYVPQIVN